MGHEAVHMSAHSSCDKTTGQPGIVQMVTQFEKSERFMRKVDLLDKQSQPRVLKQINHLSTMRIDEILRLSHKLGQGAQGALWIARLFNDYRLIYQLIGRDHIRLEDVVRQDDLNKFMGKVHS